MFALEDVAEGGRWDTLEQYRRLAVQSLRTAMSVMDKDLPGVIRVSNFLSCVASFSLRAPLAVFDVCFLLVQELEDRSLGKSIFLRRERDIW